MEWRGERGEWKGERVGESGMENDTGGEWNGGERVGEWFGEGERERGERERSGMEMREGRVEWR